MKCHFYVPNDIKI